MSRLNIIRQSKIERTPRVAQLQGIFDLDADGESIKKWEVDFDLPDEWSVGLIVGPSGCGKTTLAMELFGREIVKGFSWSKGKSIVDGFPDEMGIKAITGLLSSVGFSSPPAWLRPYHVLSNGEQFRATIARALAECQELFVVDEFTSVIDRRVAKVGSAAIQKTVRRMNKKFIAVTCHYDVIDWLDPDWVYEPSTNKFYRRSLRGRPKIKLRVTKADKKLWSVFREHHYLDTGLHKSAHCYAGYLDGDLALFGAVLHFPHPSSARMKREHRVVCLPDYQGVGAGNRFSELIASAYTAENYRYLSTTTHPAMIAYRARSEKWDMYKKPSIKGQAFARGKAAASGVKGGNHAQSTRIRASFEYVGKKMKASAAQRLLAS